MLYTALRGIMIAIGITPPHPGKEKWVALVFFGVGALIFAGVLVLGWFFLRGMAS
jgi:hypothetical protein